MIRLYLTIFCRERPLIVFVIKKHCLTPPPHPRLAGEASRTLKTNCVLANCQKHVLSRATVFVANALASMPSPVFGETRAKASIPSVATCISLRSRVKFPRRNGGNVAVFQATKGVRCACEQSRGSVPFVSNYLL